MKGGDGGADYMLKTVGSGEVQYDNVFKSSPTDVSNSDNAIKPLSMSGGSKKRRQRTMKRGRSKSGGFLGLGLAPIINQALVPFTLFGAQKWFR
jgi:hypothetical protein